MKNEIIGMCPGCLQKKGQERMVDIYVVRNDKGDITDMYIFGDDDFDVPAKNQNITEMKVSDDGKTIIEITCPRCLEKIAVSIPVIKEPEKKPEKKPYFAGFYTGENAVQKQ